jgi:hypothetical protein
VGWEAMPLLAVRIKRGGELRFGLLRHKEYAKADDCQGHDAITDHAGA